MKPDDDICLCFHVKMRKVVNFVRVEQPVSVSQISECFGAGTGCGWCRPFLKKVFDEVRAGSDDWGLPPPDDYAARRKKYVRDGGGTPPNQPPKA